LVGGKENRTGDGASGRQWELTMPDEEQFSGAYPHTPRVAVGAVVFKDEQVLLVRRGKAPSRGQWAIPGGSVTLGETLQQAAEREILEETGIHIVAGEPAYVFDVVDRDRRGRVRFHYVIIDLDATYANGELRPGDDALEARWVAASDLKGLDISPPTRRLLCRHYHFGCDEGTDAIGSG
jgi:ADP-ribose pyrophosphatase